MVKCEKCGKEFIKEKQMELIKKRVGTDIFEPLCPKCRKAAAAEKLRDIYKYVSPHN